MRFGFFLALFLFCVPGVEWLGSLYVFFLFFVVVVVACSIFSRIAVADVQGPGCLVCVFFFFFWGGGGCFFSLF